MSSVEKEWLAVCVHIYMHTLPEIHLTLELEEYICMHICVTSIGWVTPPATHNVN